MATASPDPILRAAFDLGAAHARMLMELSREARLKDDPTHLAFTQVTYFSDAATQDRLQALIETALKEPANAPLSAEDLQEALRAASFHGWYQPKTPSQTWESGQQAYARLLDELPKVPPILRPKVTGTPVKKATHPAVRLR